MSFLSTALKASAAALLICGAAAHAQTAPSSGAAAAAAAATARYTIAMVLPRDDQNIEAGFTSYLQRQDVPVRYVNIRFSGKADDVADLRSRVRAANPDLIYVWGTPTALALAGRHDQPAGTSIRDIPIVFTEVTDPVGAGLIPTLEHPALPAGGPDPSQIAPQVKSLAERGADILYVGPITFLAFTHRDAVTAAALENKLPTFCATESIVRQSGCMFGLFSNGANIGRYAASMARQILVEKKHAQDIPASTLQRFSLLINMRTVQALELYPPMLLLNVAEVINVEAQAAK